MPTTLTLERKSINLSASSVVPYGRPYHVSLHTPLFDCRVVNVSDVQFHCVCPVLRYIFHPSRHSPMVVYSYLDTFDRIAITQYSYMHLTSIHHCWSHHVGHGSVVQFSSHVPKPPDVVGLVIWHRHSIRHCTSQYLAFQSAGWVVRVVN